MKYAQDVYFFQKPSKLNSRGIWKKRAKGIKKPLLLGMVILMGIFPFLGEAKGQVTTDINPNGSINPGGFISLALGRGVNLGPIKTYPSLGFSEIYTDNTFRVGSNKKSDFIHTISPGLQGQLFLGNRFKIVADYKANKQVYQKNSGNNAFIQSGQMRVSYKPPSESGFMIDFQAGQIRGIDPRGDVLDSQLASPNKWKASSFLSRATLSGGWAGVTVDMAATKWKYLNNGQGTIRDRWSYRTNVIFFGPITSKTNLRLITGISGEQYEINTQLNSFSYSVGGGLQFSATGKTSGTFDVTYQVLNFDRAQISSPPNGLNSGGDGQEIIQLSGDITWRPTSKIDVNLRTFRSFQQTANVSTSVFVQTGVSLSVTHALRSRFSLKGNFDFQNNDFSEPTTVGGQTAIRNDDVISVGTGINYQTLKWFTVGLSYTYQNRSSTLRAFKFQANTVNLSLTAVF